MKAMSRKCLSSCFLSTLLIASLWLIVSACAGPYGRLRSDVQVTEWFQSNAVPEEYKYYYDGRSNMPFAIIGIKPEYTLVSHLWQPVQPNTPEFAYAVRFMYYTSSGDSSYPAYGSLILDDKGQNVGIWYARFRSTGVVVKPDKTIVIYSPYDGGSAGGLGLWHEWH